MYFVRKKDIRLLQVVVEKQRIPGSYDQDGELDVGKP
jgi:hypothetical protein